MQQPVMQNRQTRPMAMQWKRITERTSRQSLRRISLLCSTVIALSTFAKRLLSPFQAPV